MGLIYLIQLANFVTTNQNVYKIGRTEQSNMNNRLRNYDRGYELYIVMNVDDTLKVEKEILNAFNSEFKRYNSGDYKNSREYFIGDIDKMTDIIYEICNPSTKKQTIKQNDSNVSWGWKLLGY